MKGKRKSWRRRNEEEMEIKKLIGWDEEEGRRKRWRGRDA